MLAEDSTTMNIVGNDPIGQALVKYLHQNLHLYHLQDYVKIDALPTMKSVKESGNWVLFKGTKARGRLPQRPPQRPPAFWLLP